MERRYEWVPSGGKDDSSAQDERCVDLVDLEKGLAQPFTDIRLYIPAEQHGQMEGSSTVATTQQKCIEIDLHDPTDVLLPDHSWILIPTQPRPCEGFRRLLVVLTGPVEFQLPRKLTAHQQGFLEARSEIEWCIEQLARRWKNGSSFDFGSLRPHFVSLSLLLAVCSRGESSSEKATEHVRGYWADAKRLDLDGDEEERSLTAVVRETRRLALDLLTRPEPRAAILTRSEMAEFQRETLHKLQLVQEEMAVEFSNFRASLRVLRSWAEKPCLTFVRVHVTGMLEVDQLQQLLACTRSGHFLRLLFVESEHLQSMLTKNSGLIQKFRRGGAKVSSGRTVSAVDETTSYSIESAVGAIQTALTDRPSLADELEAGAVDQVALALAEALGWREEERKVRARIHRSSGAGAGSAEDELEFMVLLSGGNSSEIRTHYEQSDGGGRTHLVDAVEARGIFGRGGKLDSLKTMLHEEQKDKTKILAGSGPPLAIVLLNAQELPCVPSSSGGGLGSQLTFVKECLAAGIQPVLVFPSVKSVSRELLAIDVDARVAIPVFLRIRQTCASVLEASAPAVSAGANRLVAEKIFRALWAIFGSGLASDESQAGMISSDSGSCSVFFHALVQVLQQLERTNDVAGSQQFRVLQLQLHTIATADGTAACATFSDHTDIDNSEPLFAACGELLQLVMREVVVSLQNSGRGSSSFRGASARSPLQALASIAIEATSVSGNEKASFDEFCQSAAVRVVPQSIRLRWWRDYVLGRSRGQHGGSNNNNMVSSFFGTGGKKAEVDSPSGCFASNAHGGIGQVLLADGEGKPHASYSNSSADRPARGSLMLADGLEDALHQQAAMAQEFDWEGIFVQWAHGCCIGNTALIALLGFSCDRLRLLLSLPPSNIVDLAELSRTPQFRRTLDAIMRDFQPVYCSLFAQAGGGTFVGAPHYSDNVLSRCAAIKWLLLVTGDSGGEDGLSLPTREEVRLLVEAPGVKLDPQPHQESLRTAVCNLIVELNTSGGVIHSQKKLRNALLTGVSEGEGLVCPINKKKKALGAAFVQFVLTADMEVGTSFQWS